jgi:hypothetical protein
LENPLKWEPYLVLEDLCIDEDNPESILPHNKNLWGSSYFIDKDGFKNFFVSQAASQVKWMVSDVAGLKECMGA